MTAPFFGHADTSMSPPGMRTVLAGIRREDIVVQPIAGSGWRICDGRISEDDAQCLLGYVEKKGDRFELMQLAPGFAWFSYGSLTETVTHFTRERYG